MTSFLTPLGRLLLEEEIPSDTPLLRQMAELIPEGLFESAVILASYLISALGDCSLVGGVSRASCLCLAGDAHLGLRDVAHASQALACYKDAESHLASSGGAYGAVLKMKMADAFLLLKQPKQAMLVLEALQPHDHTCKSALILARLLESSTFDGKCSAFYRLALDKNPNAVEAQVALAGRRKTRPQPEQPSEDSHKPPFSTQFLSTVVSATAEFRSHRYGKARDLASNLLSQYPDHPATLRLLANCHFFNGRPNDCLQLLRRLQKVEPHTVQDKGLLALLLHEKGDVDELSRMAHVLMDTNHSLWQPWMAFGLVFDLLDKKDEAIRHIDRAILLQPKSSLCLVARARVCLHYSDQLAAVECFQRAIRQQPACLVALEGLVNIHLELEQFREALYTAKQAKDNNAGCAKALTLCGVVLSKSAQGRVKAHKAYDKALSMDEHCTDAIVAKAKLLGVEGEAEGAVALLRHQLQGNDRHTVHVEIARLLYQTGDCEQALFHVHQALSIHPEFPNAVELLHLMEQDMRGEGDEVDDMGDGDSEDDVQLQ